MLWGHADVAPGLTSTGPWPMGQYRAARARVPWPRRVLTAPAAGGPAVAFESSPSLPAALVAGLAAAAYGACFTFLLKARGELHACMA